MRSKRSTQAHDIDQFVDPSSLSALRTDVRGDAVLYKHRQLLVATGQRDVLQVGSIDDSAKLFCKMGEKKEGGRGRETV